jgi:hypothetical protein
MRDAMMFDVESGAYFPTVFMNDFWLLRSYLVAVNGSLPAVNLTVTVSPLGIWQGLNRSSALKIGQQS